MSKLTRILSIWKKKSTQCCSCLVQFPTGDSSGDKSSKYARVVFLLFLKKQHVKCYDLSGCIWLQQLPDCCSADSKVVFCPLLFSCYLSGNKNLIPHIFYQNNKKHINIIWVDSQIPCNTAGLAPRDVTNGRNRDPSVLLHSFQGTRRKERNWLPVSLPLINTTDQPEENSHIPGILPPVLPIIMKQLHIISNFQKYRHMSRSRFLRNTTPTMC